MLLSNVLKKRCVILSLSLMSILPNAFANQEQVNEHDFNMNQITSHELAMLSVIVDACPSLIEVTPDYQKNIKAIVTAHLPDAKNPLAELKIRSQSDELRPLMLEAQQIFAEIGDEANKSLCEDIRDYQEK